MIYKVKVVRGKSEGRLKFSHGDVQVDTTCWWDPKVVIDSGTYTGFATRMASKTDGFDGGKREAIWLGKNVGYNDMAGRKSDAIFIHKGTSAAWSDGCIVADTAEVLKIWKAITPKEQPNVSIEVLSLAEERAQIGSQIIKEHGIIERDAWGATGPWSTRTEDWAFDSIVVHHSGNWGEKDPREIEAKHKKKNFEDIGYHYMIHPNSTIYEGRPITFKGEHVAGANTKKIGILMMGDYDEQWWDPDDALTEAHVKELRALVRTLKRFFPLNILGGHKEYLKGYTCPGNLLMAKMDGLREALGLTAPKSA